jgi:hypothetical protein
MVLVALLGDVHAEVCDHAKGGCGAQTSFIRRQGEISLNYQKEQRARVHMRNLHEIHKDN